MTSASSTAAAAVTRWLRNGKEKEAEKDKKAKELEQKKKRFLIDGDRSAIGSFFACTDRSAEAGVKEPFEKVEFLFCFERPNTCCVCERRFLSPAEIAKIKAATEGKAAKTSSKATMTEGKAATTSSKAESATTTSHKRKFEEIGQNDEKATEFVVEELMKLCRHHESWLENEESETNHLLFASSVIKNIALRANEDPAATQNGRFRRICTTCFESTIVSQILDRPSTLQYVGKTNSLMIQCPVCDGSRTSLLTVNTLLPLLLEENRKRVAPALERELILRSNVVLHCPVKDCAHTQLIPKNKVPPNSEVSDSITVLPKAVSCKDHGKHCTKCWNPIADEQKQHSCNGVPKEMLKLLSAHLAYQTLRRCNLCRIPIEKNGGCNDMICKCGGRFDWSKAEVPQKTKITLNDDND